MSRTIAVVGAGVIGLSWTTLFLAKGFRVRLCDPRPDLTQITTTAIPELAPTVPGFTGDPAELLTRLECTADTLNAVRDVHAVQENGPEDLEFKQNLFAALEKAAPPDALLLSSTSGLVPSLLGARMADPGRILVGHPFNPPHLLPLVELVPHPDTAAELVERAAGFYRDLGKVPVTLRTESRGFVANRLQGALFAEAVTLVQDGVVTPAELDLIVRNSLGIRWAAVGPFEALHLGGGPGGLRHLLTHLGPGMARGWAQRRTPVLDESTVDTLATAADQDFGSADYPGRTRRRDDRQLAILAALTTTEGA
ncbi:MULTISPECIES: 3-hydroxyacyl-CoA dehydrogenase NAD-binding domain-containing protein [unclassified Crossiella]|uniref:3-hydroxyacyl-CoA dehydrogenase NAD-binding domain-containing protein n=1 Tax=unclassified Crossiella TaxID=2620835 RepID=UPI0020004793|nr:MULTISPECIES: 3-hydroxyacyl-CoA dehydrogenase NAD-binding domain-containing protein [unclassified Crossiella]MCK2238473.1 3-hydroxyacyl-CoA dehydrogenase NAD-binding domain-containing protein [Crossiella sp. S99.2]MCK2251957.1 3-hydroxyacyl-CoA dehydrogenase NAD-binding domain-containing protein [Crossiella sp. S99.1]